jgi:FixJ family two-component response regulator
MKPSTSKPTSLKNAQTVYIVDDDDALRGAVGSLIRSVGHTVKEFSSPVELFSNLVVEGAGCLILDVRLKGYSGFDVQREMSESGIHLPVIFMTGHGDIPMSVRAMKAGAVDFFSKPLRHDELLQSVANALLKDQERLANDERLLRLRQRYAGLSAREKQVMHEVIKGRLNKQISGDLEISIVTVKVHRANTMRKMCAATLADLVRAGRLLALS